MNVLLTTLNAKYIHKNLAIRWLYVTRPKEANVEIQEYTINDDLTRITPLMHLEDFDVVGISTYIWNSEYVKQWIPMIRKANPKIKIILGGPDVTFDNDDWFDHDIDAISVGEGEVELWKYIMTGKSECTKEHKGEAVRVGRVDLAYLEQFEDPYFLDFDLKDLYHRYLYVETSRGCPFGCAYCLSETDRVVRKFSDEYMERIYRKMEEYPIRQVKFLDRTFNLDYQKSLATLRRLQEIKSVESFQMELVAETLPEEMIRYMIEKMDKKKFRFEVGVQSFNEKTLQSVNRKSDLTRLKDVIRRLNAAGVILHTDLIAGLPYEDIVSFENSFNTLFSLYTEEVQLGILKLLKGTSLRYKAANFGIIASENSPYEVEKTSWLSEEDLKRIHMVALGCEKSYNNGRMQHTVKTILEDTGCSAFRLFETIGNVVNALPHPYQLPLYFHKMYEALEGTLPEEHLKACLLYDYYRKTKNRPSALFYSYSDKTYLRKSGKFNLYELEHYAVYMPFYSKKRMIHQLVVYHRNNEVCQHYLVDEENNRIEEIKL